MGPRLVERGKQRRGAHPNARAGLQWGRAWLSAESFLVLPDRPIERPASMGPRLVERGKTPASRTRGSRCGMLQWGRAWLSAESPCQADQAGLPEQASMGPRLVKRGKHMNHEQIIDLNRASMGPRLVERGKIVEFGPKAAKRIASMGPRLVERGKDGSARRLRCGRGGFNGAALG